MSEYKLSFPEFTRPPLSLNEARRAHFHQQAKAKKLVGNAVYEEAQRQCIPPLKPCTVLTKWYVKDKRRRDCEGLVVFQKAALDALVKAGLWDDDNSDYVIRTSQEIDKSDKQHPRIEIHISEVE